MIGEVISFSRMRGWGFIRGHDGAETFVHRGALENARYLVAGETVEFRLGKHGDRTVAVHVFVERGSKDD